MPPRSTAEMRKLLPKPEKAPKRAATKRRRQGARAVCGRTALDGRASKTRRR